MTFIVSLFFFIPILNVICKVNSICSFFDILLEDLESASIEPLDSRKEKRGIARASLLHPCLQ